MILNEFFESNSGKGTNENKPEPTAGSWQDIWKQNPDIKNPNLIFPGQQIKLPNNTFAVVDRGDTLSGIAQRYQQGGYNTGREIAPNAASPASVRPAAQPAVPAARPAAQPTAPAARPAAQPSRTAQSSQSAMASFPTKSGRVYAADFNNPSGIGWDGKGKYTSYKSPEEGVLATKNLVSRYISNQTPYIKGPATPEQVVSTWVSGGVTPAEKIQGGRYLQSVRNELAAAGVKLDSQGRIPNTQAATDAITRAIVRHETSRKHLDKFAPYLNPKQAVPEGVAEVSDTTKQSYKAKAQAQVRELEPHAKKGEYKDIAQRAIDRRTKGLARVKHSDSAQQSVSETAMKDKAIEFQDYKTMAPGAFYSRYGMTRDQWLTSNRNLFSRPKNSEQVRDRELAKMRALVAARADVRAAQSLAPRVSESFTLKTPEGRPALGQFNMTTVVRDYHQNLPFANLSFGNSGNLKIDRKQMRVIMDHYLGLLSPEEKHDFVYETMSRLLKVVALFDRYKVDVRNQIELPVGQKSEIPGVQPKLLEVDASQVKDTRLSRALKQARAEFPTAGSDIEAFLKLVMSNDDRDLKTMSQIQTVNQQQSKIIDRIQDIDQKQNQEIDSIDAELDRVTKINRELERQLDQMGRGKPSRTADKLEPASAAEPVATAPKAQPRVDLPVGSQEPVKKAPAKTQAVPAPKAPETPALPNYSVRMALPPTASPNSVSFGAMATPPINAQQALPLGGNDNIISSNNVIPFQQRFNRTGRGDPDEPVTDVVPKDYSRLQAEFLPSKPEPERQQRVGEGTKTKNIGQKGFDSFTQDDWDQWDKKVQRLGQRAQQAQPKPAKVNEPKVQPSTDKKSKMTESRLHRRAVLRQILES